MLYFALAAVSAVIFVNGWTDAPNAVAAAVGSGSIKAGRAVTLAAVFNFIGVLAVIPFGGGVARTVASIADFGKGDGALGVLGIGMCAVTLWAVSAWYFGIPTSESHALVSAVSGAAAAFRGRASFDADEWGRVALGLLLSTLPAFLLGIAAYHAVRVVVINANRHRIISRLVCLQRFGAAAGALFHGLQDGQKFMGIIILCFVLREGGELPERLDIPFAVVLYCAVLMAGGTALGGGRIIRKIAFDMVSLDPPRGVAADISSSVCLVICTAAGLPVSTTHTRTCAVMGAGAGGQSGHIDKSVVRELLAAWGLTFPACFALGWLFSKIFIAIGG